MRKCHCRCRKCGARQVRSMHPDLYLRTPKCRACGRKGTLRPDKWMNNRWRTQVTCGCTGYWFIHRRGSKYCHFRANGEERQLGDLDFHDRYLEKLHLKYGNIASLTEAQREHFEERAGILEFEANLHRPEAERRALLEAHSLVGEGALWAHPGGALEHPLPLPEAGEGDPPTAPPLAPGDHHEVPPPCLRAGNLPVPSQ